MGFFWVFFGVGRTVPGESFFLLANNKIATACVCVACGSVCVCSDLRCLKVVWVASDEM